jgi:hypothetical protein
MVYFKGMRSSYPLGPRILTQPGSSQPGKTAEDGAGFVLQIFDHAGPSAYKYLRRWFNLHGL